MTSFTFQEPGLREDGREYCSCCRFTTGIDLPYPRDLSLKEIKAEALRYSTRVLKNWTQLNGYLKRFEAIIQRRWLRKSNKQREQVLQKAWPDMSRHHRPDFVGCRNKKQQRKLSQAITANKRSQAFLWPYINLEDLQQGHLLLLFLNSRGRELPAAFVTTDLLNAHRGHGWPSEVEDGEAGIAFAKGSTPKSYGRVIVQKGSVSQRVIRPAFPPIVGLFILEVQDGIYNFLLECARLIMHDIDTPNFYISPSVPEPKIIPEKSNRSGTPWHSLPAYALESPYRRPQQLNINRLQTLISARRAAAEDHIWLLREDPWYFAETLNDVMEHGREQYEKAHDREHAWKHAAGRMLSDAFCSFMLWDELDEKLAILPPMQIQLRDANPKTGRLVGYDESTWAYLDAIMEKLMCIPLGMLDRGVPMSPRIRAISYIEFDEEGKHYWELKPGRTDAEERIYVLFWALFDEKQMELHGLSNLLQEIQHVIDTEPEVADLLDPWIIDKFGDLALLAEFRRNIDTFEPWVRGWRMNKVAEKGFVNFAVRNSLDRDEAHLGVLNNAPCHASNVLGVPTDGRFHYPIDRVRTKETVEQMRGAEQTLSDFWDEISNYFLKHTKRVLMDEFMLRSHRKSGVYKTPRWVEPMPGGSEEGGVTLPAPPTTPLRELDINAWRGGGSENKRREVLDSAKALRNKTRGGFKPSDPPMPMPEQRAADAEPDASSQQRIKLPRRIYRVFAAMLPSADAQGHVGKEIAWDELCYAFSYVGMQPEKLYGSVWVFKPLPKGECKIDGLTRSISFHEPREVRRGHKCPSKMTKVFGRRLKHAYGWCGEMFECE